MAHDRLHNLPSRAFVTATVFAILSLSAPRPGGAADPPDREKARTILARGAELYAVDPSAATPSPGAAAAAEELVLQGVELRKQRKHLEAYDRFRRAFEISPTPRPTAQLGLVEYQLGRWVDAEVHLEQAVKAPDDPFIRQNRETINQALETVRSHIAYLEIKGTPDGAEVSVNGRKVGALPLAGLVKAGDGYAEVLVSAPGYRTTRHTLNLQPALTQQFFVTLERQPPPGAPGVSSTSLDDRASREAPDGDPSPSSGSPRLRTAGLATGAVGIAALGYGLYQTYRVRTLSEDVRRADTQGVARGRAAERQQWLGYGLGAAALATSTLLYWLGKPTERPPALSLAAVAAPDTFLFSLHLRH